MFESCMFQFVIIFHISQTIYFYLVTPIVLCDNCVELNEQIVSQTLPTFINENNFTQILLFLWEHLSSMTTVIFVC